MSNITNGGLVEEYLKGRAILLKPPSSRSQKEIDLLKQWLLERVKLFSSLQLSEGMCMKPSSCRAKINQY